MKARHLLCLLILLLSACQGEAGLPLPPAPQALPVEPAPEATGTLPNQPTRPTLPPEATEVLAPLVFETTPAAPPPQSESPAPGGSKPASPAPDPLRFVFPTAGPAPVAAWRPPLYPTPWAPTPYDHFYFSRPIGADQVNWPLADYRYGGVFFENVIHTGVDIPAPKGTNILAAAPGRVAWAGFGLYAQKEDLNDPYGLAVAIKHDFGYQGETLYTIYGHLDQLYVMRGQRVEGGELIGTVGETGKVTGPHLHFEVRMGKNNFFGSRNPELWTSPPQGWGVLAGRVTNTLGELLIQETIHVFSYATFQHWTVKTYGEGSVNSDPYYRENVVMGDLPAGKYNLWIAYDGATYRQDIEIQPGLVSYFTFQGRKEFSIAPPPPPGPAFIPPDITPTLKPGR